VGFDLLVIEGKVINIEKGIPTKYCRFQSNFFNFSLEDLWSRVELSTL
jgi:hypothetical protein